MAFEEKFFKGELTPSLKSEEPSEEDMAEPVKVVKGKSFSKMVLENGKPCVRYILHLFSKLQTELSVVVILMVNTCDARTVSIETACTYIWREAYFYKLGGKP